MGNPPSRPEPGRVCPVCHHPVPPDYKFCEVCGARIPALVTCRKCGTQFFHPAKYCDLCGTPFSQDDLPEENPDETPEPADEETTEPVPEEPGKPEGEGTEGTAAGEPEEPEEEELLRPETGKRPQPEPRRMPEPDTDELLKTFGAEYNDNETLESLHTQESAPSIRHTDEAEKVHARMGKGFRDTVDDALFLIDKGQASPKGRSPRIAMIAGGCILLLAIALLFFIGLPAFSGGNQTTPEPTQTPVPVATVPTTPQPVNATNTTAPGVSVTQTTQQIPTDQKYYFLVQKDPITFRITATFVGSASAIGISSAEVTVTRPGGSVATGIIMPQKGVSEITLAGSDGTDHVQIVARMSSGKTYVVIDRLVPVSA